MEFFKNYRKTAYTFGDDYAKIGGAGRQIEFVQDISQYVDVIDQVREGVIFGEPYNIIENERPDQVSQFLYDTPIYHWTFFMMNESLREHGWPLTLRQIDEVITTDFPHQFLQFRADISNIFLQNEFVTGGISGIRGKIIKRHIDLGVIVVDTGGAQFRKGEVVTCTGLPQNTAILPNVATGYEYDAPHHYEDASGDWVDIDPLSPAPALYNEITVKNRYHTINESLKQIKVIKPGNIVQIASAYKRALTS